MRIDRHLNLVKREWKLWFGGTGDGVDGLEERGRLAGGLKEEVLKE